MIYVGTDIAELGYFAVVVSLEGEILIEPFQFSDDYGGFHLLLSKLAPLDQHSIITGLESTAHYGDNLVRFLICKDFKACAFDPIMTSSMHKNNVRKMRTDKANTLVIAKTLMMQDSLRLSALEDLDYTEPKKLGRFRQKIIKQRTRLKIQLTSYTDQAFPGFQYLFKFDLHQKVAYTLLKRALMLKDVTSLHLTHPSGLSIRSSHGYLTEDMVRELRILAQRSIGLNGSSLSIQIAQAIAQIELLDSQLFETKLEMTNFVICLYSVFMTIFGIGTVNGGTIPGEIGDIHRFSTLGKLLVFAGLGPIVYQPGNLQVKRTYMPKRESRVLHYALMNVAHNIVKSGATFKAYCDTRRAEGRTYYDALRYRAGEFVRIIRRMLASEMESNLEQRPVY